MMRDDECDKLAWGVRSVNGVCEHDDKLIKGKLSYKIRRKIEFGVIITLIRAMWGDNTPNAVIRQLMIKKIDQMPNSRRH